MTETDVEVRPMRISDLKTVIALEREIFPDPWSRDSFRREVEAVRVSWTRVAMSPSTGEMLGYLVAWFVADEVHLANVAVAPAARRRGVAQFLLDELETEGRRRKARFIVLEVRRSNDSARRLYGRNDYYTVDVRKGYYRNNREDAIVMVKPLSESGRIPPLEGPDL
jgi:ribosomal-protein-alanine N-acetyltransferase